MVKIGIANKSIRCRILAPYKIARLIICLLYTSVQLMGEVQLEILQNILQDRFGLDVTFSEGGILYKETLTLSLIHISGACAARRVSYIK